VKVEGEEPSEIFGQIMSHSCANMHCINVLLYSNLDLYYRMFLSICVTEFTTHRPRA